jgi:hypothetical protein
MWQIHYFLFFTVIDRDVATGWCMGGDGMGVGREVGVYPPNYETQVKFKFKI